MTYKVLPSKKHQSTYKHVLEHIKNIAYIYIFIYICAVDKQNQYMINIFTLKERLTEIVNSSYWRLCNIVSKNISVSNEASLQLHLGVILKQIGQLYEFEANDRFYIQLEDVQSINRLGMVEISK